MPADTAPELLLADGKQTALGRTVTATRPGVALSLSVPPERKLERAALEIAATGVSTVESVVASIKATTDAGALPAAAGARWVSADWGTELAVVSLKIDGADPTGLQTGMRVKLFSNGNWLPLPPLDTLKLGAEQQFPAMAASRLMAEMLLENKVNDKPTGVLVPGAVKASAIAIKATKQPCHVEIAIGDDPPFFTYPGALPSAPVSVSGLARVANRYLADHPAATGIPLRISAAAPADVLVASFVSTLVPLPAPEQTRPTEHGGAGPDKPLLPTRPEAEYLSVAEPQTRTARLSDAQHTPAQCFEALPEGKLLSSLDLYVRATTAGVKGRVTMHPDQGGKPGPEPLADGAVDVPSAPGRDPEASWLTLTLAKPLDLSSGRWWAVCSVAEGELIWYAGTDAPKDKAGPALYRVGTGPWLPVLATPDPAPWIQARLRVTAAGA